MFKKPYRTESCEATSVARIRSPPPNSISHVFPSLERARIDGLVPRIKSGVQSRSVAESGKLILSERHYGPDTSWQRHDHARHPNCDTAKAPLKKLAVQYGLNHKTVAKWRKRAFVNDAPMGPKAPRSTVLSPRKRLSSSP